MEELLNELKKIVLVPYKRYENIDEILRKIKNIANNYYSDDVFNKEYRYYIEKIERGLLDLPIEYICDTTSVFRDLRGVNNNVKYSKKRSTYQIEDYLDYVVYFARKQLINGLDLRKNFNKYDLTNHCYEASEQVKIGADLCDLKCYVICIDPGFEADSRLFNGCGYHYFNIIAYQNKYYLVDVSYKQFFAKEANSFERMGVPFIFPPSAGIYMLLDDSRKKIATIINKYGWIELTDEVLKAYMDGFALSYRNALYYEDKKIAYETNYTAKDYKNFLIHEDSQVKHEGSRVLGYQRELVKDGDAITGYKKKN